MFESALRRHPRGTKLRITRQRALRVALFRHGRGQRSSRVDAGCRRCAPLTSRITNCTSYIAAAQDPAPRGHRNLHSAAPGPAGRRQGRNGSVRALRALWSGTSLHRRARLSPLKANGSVTRHPPRPLAVCRWNTPLTSYSLHSRGLLLIRLTPHFAGVPSL